MRKVDSANKGLRLLALCAALMVTPFLTLTAQAQKEKKPLDKALDTIGDAVDSLRGKEATPAPGAVAAPSEALSKNIADWPVGPKEAVEKMVAKYGAPDEFTPSMVMWHNMDMTKPTMAPWKHIHVHRHEVSHNFPVAHTDFLKQVINYQVPTEMISELAAMDGSLMVNRTAGEIAVICDKEENNILALNLAHDIVVGKRTASEARKFLTDTIAASMRGEKPPYMQKIMFQVPKSGTADKDKTTLKASAINPTVGEADVDTTTEPKPKKAVR